MLPLPSPFAEHQHLFFAHLNNILFGYAPLCLSCSVCLSVCGHFSFLISFNERSSELCIARVVSPLWSLAGAFPYAFCLLPSVGCCCPLPIAKVGNNFINCSTVCNVFNVQCYLPLYVYENIQIIIYVKSPRIHIVSRCCLFWACLFSSALYSTLSGADKCVCVCVCSLLA